MSQLTKPAAEMSARDLVELLDEIRPLIMSKILSAQHDDERASMELSDRAKRIGIEADRAEFTMQSSYGSD